MNKPFKETILDRIERDELFRNDLLKEAIRCIDDKEFEIAKAMIKHCLKEINDE
tara:strand:+ start:1697 stop:1858 length:162 start_codon:yes stop_codon:yes gene_type:complete